MKPPINPDEGTAREARMHAIRTVRVSDRHGVRPADSERRADERAYVTTGQYVDSCEVDSLLLRGLITERQRHAGIAFRRAWQTMRGGSGYASRYEPRVEQSSTRGAEPGYKLDAEVAIKAMLDGMTEAVALAVQAVCGEDEKGARRLRHLIPGLDHLAEFQEGVAHQRRMSA